MHFLTTTESKFIIFMILIPMWEEKKPNKFQNLAKLAERSNNGKNTESKETTNLSGYDQTPIKPVRMLALGGEVPGDP